MLNLLFNEIGIMKVAILETGHFQYTLTQSEVFSDCDVCIITTADMKKDMIEYHPETNKYPIYLITSIKNNENEILKIINEKKIDLLLISPIFDSYPALKRIVKSVRCIKVLTTHNINTWFHGRFWSPNSLMDKLNMKSIIKNCDYIAVEDFIYNHLKSTNDILFRRYKFIYIPFTIFHNSKLHKYSKKDNRIKVVLTGAIDGDRRRYEEVIETIHHFAGRSNEITFSFAGRAKGDYGLNIQKQLREIKKLSPDIVSFFEDNSTADMFRQEMETSDIVLSTSTVTFKGMGTTEYIGKTKPTAAIHDMMTYELPGLLPAHLQIPVNLTGSAFNYSGAKELIEILERLLADKTIIQEWKHNAKTNSLKFTASEIRKGLPF